MLRHRRVQPTVSRVGVYSLVAALATLVAQPRMAQSSAPPLIASLDASSSVRDSLLVFDGVAETGWCPRSADRKGELVLRFPRPVRVKSLTIYGGRMSMRHLTDDWHRPTPLEVGAGELVINVDPRGQGQGPLAVDTAKGRTFDKLSLRLPPAGPREQRCLAEVDVELEDGPWFFGIPATAVDALPTAIKEMAKALRSCDLLQLKQMVRFPVVRWELQTGFAGAEKHIASGRPRRYGDVDALAKDCRELVFPAGERPGREPKALYSLAPGIVRVEGNRGGGAVFWRLRWTTAGWRLVAIELTAFE